MAESTATRPQRPPTQTTPPVHPAVRDALCAFVWAVVATACRWPVVARIEGVLDHDQSVVGLMALDIAAGRRFPIFFDGQRYMGAVEAYLAAAFVRVWGHSPTVVALAPLLAYGAFVAGQFAIWARWRGRPTGHLAAGLAAVGAPMLGVWGVVPRGGYVEFLAWGLPTLWAYRETARRGRAELSPLVQALWGFWLAFGYFLNPLALTVYVTIALDWTFGRHGADLRRERGLAGVFPAWVGPVVGLGFVVCLAACCHVDPRAEDGGLYVVLLGFTRARWGLIAGTAGVLGLIAAAAWWSRGAQRLYAALAGRPAAVAGALVALSPMVAFTLLVRVGVYPPAPSLPVWIAAPWKALPTARTALGALGTLVGCDPRALETVLAGQGVLPSEPSRPAAAAVLGGLSPAVVAVALGLIALGVWKGRDYWSGLCTLRRDDVAPGPALAALFSGVALALYLLQGTSPNASSVRYLLPLWVALPGLLACGVLALPGRLRAAGVSCLVVPWGVAHALVAADVDRPSPARPLAAALLARGVSAVAAPTPVALIVANLTHGAVGAVEYRPIWPRLGDRYRDRFRAGRPVVCVVDPRLSSDAHGDGGWSPGRDFAGHLRGLAARHPGRVRRTGEVRGFELWETDLPLDEVLAPEPDGPP